MSAIDVKVSVESFYTFHVGKLSPAGEVLYRREVAGVSANLLLDQGLDRLGANTGWAAYCQVGSGNTPPVDADTGLETFVAATNTQESATRFAQGSPPYYSSAVKTYRFAPGTATGNLSEVGVGWGSGASDLLSRALIVDGGGSPTTITVLADEFLDVTYTLRVYPPTVDVVDSITISGVEYDYVLRACTVTAAYSSSGFDFTWGYSIDSFNSSGQATTATSAQAYNGSLGAITTVPSGTTDARTSQSNAAYGTNDLYRDVSFVWGLSDGNLAGGISAVAFRIAWSSWQISFSPPIAKDATKTLSLTFRVTWDRYAP